MKSKTNLELVVDERGGLKMKSRHMFSYLLFAACMLVCAAEMASAASITYVGSQMNIEDDADTPTDGWRNTTPAKPLDIDGDNILGTDGYYIFKWTSVPSYATVTIPAGASGFGPYGTGYWDDPSDPSGADVNNHTVIRHDGGYVVGELSTSLLQIAITGTDLDGKILRLGVLSDWVVGADHSGDYLANYTITQTAGSGSASVSSSDLVYNGNALDVAFFDIDGAVAGDTFTVKTTLITAPEFPNPNYFQQFVGVTFDSVDGPPAGTVVIIK